MQQQTYPGMQDMMTAQPAAASAAMPAYEAQPAELKSGKKILDIVQLASPVVQEKLKVIRAFIDGGDHKQAEEKIWELYQGGFIVDAELRPGNDFRQFLQGAEAPR